MEQTIHHRRNGTDIRFREAPRTPVVASVLMIVGTLAIPLMIFLTDGSLVLGAALVSATIVLLLTVYRLDWGLLIWVGLVMVSDNYQIPGFEPITHSLSYLLTLNSVIPGLSVGVLAPIEIHMGFIIVVYLLLAAFGKTEPREKMPLAYPAALFFGWLIVSLLYGKMRGGDIQIGLWEIRALLFFAVTFFLVRRIITTKEQVKNLLWVCIIAISIKAYQASDRFISIGFDFFGHRALANHEDPVFIVTVFILLFGLMLYNVNVRQRWTLLLLTPVLSLGFYVANRRAAYAALGVCIISWIALISSADRRKIMLLLAFCTVGFCLYLAAYWDSYGRLAVIAQAVKSTAFSSDKEMTRGSDYSSGLARDHENYNLSVTFHRSPVMGIGFGNKHETPVRVYGDYALKGYITHNQILWLLTKTGSIGFFFFLFFMNLIVMYGAFTFSGLTDPYLKAVCLLCVMAVLNQIIVSYVDMQLTYYRNMVYLGLLTGIISTLGEIDRVRTAPHPSMNQQGLS